MILETLIVHADGTQTLEPREYPDCPVPPDMETPEGSTAQPPEPDGSAPPDAETPDPDGAPVSGEAPSDGGAQDE